MHRSNDAVTLAVDDLSEDEILIAFAIHHVDHLRSLIHDCFDVRNEIAPAIAFLHDAPLVRVRRALLSLRRIFGANQRGQAEDAERSS